MKMQPTLIARFLCVMIFIRRRIKNAHTKYTHCCAKASMCLFYCICLKNKGGCLHHSGQFIRQDFLDFVCCLFSLPSSPGGSSRWPRGGAAPSPSPWRGRGLHTQTCPSTNYFLKPKFRHLMKSSSSLRLRCSENLWCQRSEVRLTSSPPRLLVRSQRQEKLRPGQLLIGCHGREQRWFDDLIGGGGRGSCSYSSGGGSGGGRGNRDLAELPGEVWWAETAILLQADASVLTEQRTQDCRGGNKDLIRSSALLALVFS